MDGGFARTVRAKFAHSTLFGGRKNDANPTVRRIFCLASSLRYCSPPQSKQAHRREAIMSRQETEAGTAASEYLTVPELAKMVRRNRKTVYGWIATGEIGFSRAVAARVWRFYSSPPRNLGNLVADGAVCCEPFSVNRKSG
jgi:helix-turn-helix protein